MVALINDKMNHIFIYVISKNLQLIYFLQIRRKWNMELFKIFVLTKCSTILMLPDR